MAGIQKTIYVYDDFSCNEPLFMGTLYVSVIKGGESYSFEYNNEWLKKTGLMLTVDPELLPYSGRWCICSRWQQLSGYRGVY